MKASLKQDAIMMQYPLWPFCPSPFLVPKSGGGGDRRGERDNFFVVKPPNVFNPRRFCHREKNSFVDPLKGGAGICTLHWVSWWARGSPEPVGWLRVDWTVARNLRPYSSRRVDASFWVNSDLRNVLRLYHAGYVCVGVGVRVSGFLVSWFPPKSCLSKPLPVVRQVAPVEISFQSRYPLAPPAFSLHSISLHSEHPQLP